MREMLNGKEVLREPYILNPQINWEVATTYITDHTVTLAQSGHTLVMDAATVSKTFTLPSVGAADDGVEFTFINMDTGRLTIDAVDSDTIAHGTNTTIYSDDNDVSQITLRYIHAATRWYIKSAHGTWTTSS